MNLKRMRAGLLILVLLGAAFPLPGRALSILLPTDRSVPPLTLVRHEQSVVISDQVARTTLRQVFHNPTGRTLEAHYLFPVPKGAQVTDFSMIINGERVHGEVLEREKARQTFEDIVRRLRDPGLIEYMDDNLLRIRIFPIPPNGDQSIELQLSQVLPREGSLVRYEFPFGADPGRTGLPAEHDAASLAIEIRSDHPLTTVYSPTHTLNVKKSNDDHAADIEVNRKDLALGRDFLLYYATSYDRVGISRVAYRPDPNEPGYFMLLLSPREDENADEALPKDVTFVLDTSGSMAHNGKLDQAKEALIQCIGALRKGDRFNLVVFSTDVDRFADEFLTADAASREGAGKFIDKLIPRGGTNIEGALKEALNTVTDKDRLHVVVFMTDGQPTVGQTVPMAIVHDVEQRNTAGLRIFPFGIGYDVNTRLLDDIADTTRAVADYIKPKEPIEQKVTTFFDKVSAPVLTNCTLDISDGGVFDLYPQTVHDVFEGQQVMIFGRYRKSGPTAITLKGKKRGKTETYVFETEFPKTDDASEFVEPLWGTRKIGFLLDQIRRNGESEELRDEVVRLARKYNVVTPYTSYLVTEDQPAPVPPLAQPARPIHRTDMLGRGPALLVMPDLSSSTAPAPMEAGRAAPGMGVAPSAAPGASIYGGLQATSGQAAVDQSLALRRMKESDTLAGEAPSAAPETRKTVAGFTLVLHEGVWTDEKAFEKTELPTLKIQFGSAAWFELLRLRKDLKPVLELGDRVLLRLDRVILDIGPEGVTELGDKERALL